MLDEIAARSAPVEAMDSIVGWLWKNRELIGLIAGLASGSAVLLGFLAWAFNSSRSILRWVGGRLGRDREPYRELVRQFVGREVELARFRRLLEDHSGNRRFILSSWERPGMGKSWLLARMISYCRLEDIPLAKVDFFDSHPARESPLHFLLLIVEQLRSQEFERFTSEYRSASHASEMYRLTRPLDSHEIWEAEQQRQIESLVDAFWEGVASVVHKFRRCCLFLDHFEVIEAGPVEAFLRDQWIERCPASLRKVVTIVISGWNQLTWGAGMESKIQTLKLSTFSEEEVASRLSRSLPRSSNDELKRIAHIIYERTYGWPIAVGIAVTVLTEGQATLRSPEAVARLFEIQGPVDEQLRLQVLTSHLLERLSPSRREILRYLSVPRWFTTGQLAALGLFEQHKEDILLDMRQRLASVIRPREPEGFLIDEPFRSYVVESWSRDSPDGVRECHRRLSEYYRRIAGTLRGSRSLEYLLEAFHHDVESYSLGALERTAVVREFTGLYFEAERLAFLQIGEAALRELQTCGGDTLIQPWVHVFAARLAYWKGSWDEARAKLSEFMRDKTIPLELSLITTQFMATLAYYRGDLPLAEECVRIVQENRASIPPADYARFMTEIGGDTLRARGRTEAAMSEYMNAGPVLLAARDLSNAAWANLNLANMYRLTGQFSRSNQLCRGALSLVEQTDNLRLRGRVLYTLGRTLMYQGDWDEALRCHTEAIDSLRRAAASPLEIAAAQRNQADVLQLLGRQDVAERAYADAFSAFLTLGARLEQGYLLGNLGDLWQIRGDFSAAEDFYLLSLEVKRESLDEYGIAMIRRALGEMYLLEGRCEAACAVLGTASRRLEVGRHQYMRAKVLAGLLAATRPKSASAASAVAKDLAQVLRAARRDGDAFADVISDLCLFLAVNNPRPFTALTNGLNHVARYLTHALRWASAFNDHLATIQLHRYCAALSHRGASPEHAVALLRWVADHVEANFRDERCRQSTASAINAFLNDVESYRRCGVQSRDCPSERP